jgi:spermidine synthase
MKPGSRLLTISLCFFLSGVAGLIYQVAWTKSLGLIFGHTVYAVATVLAAFMAGLAAGSALLGRWGGRHTRPVAIYGWIEILIAATGALSLLGLEAVRALYLIAYGHVAGSAATLLAVRFTGAALVLFLPTFLMGSTLPILTSGISRKSGNLGARLSRLYWVNTAGAVAGSLLAGFFLLPSIGLRHTVLLAAALNLLAGLIALAIGDTDASSAVPAPVDASSAYETHSYASHAPLYLLICFGVIGATAMSYEIAWSRLLSTTLGSSTYAFTIMLATFLLGIALGSRLFEMWTSRGRKISLRTLSTTQTLTGLAAILFLLLFQWLPVVPWTLVTATGRSFGGLLFAQFATAALAMLPAAIVFGFNFPVVTVLIAGGTGENKSDSALVGRALASNTLGAILGAIAAGFWLVPRLGSFRLVAATAAVNLLVAFYVQASHPRRHLMALAANATLALIVVVTGWSGLLYDPAIANFSIVNHPELYPPHLHVDEIAHLTDLVFTEDGLNATIEVARAENSLLLRTNGKTDASTKDTHTQLMLGHLGAIFHPAPRKVLIIGFASGMTASAVARYPEIEQIDCLEIEPAMLHAAPYLGSLNRGVLNDPRLHIILDDARNFLFTTKNHYDLIISEPSNPWIAGVATLFTAEFYRQVHSRLSPGGMFVQWMQAYSIFPQDIRMILGTMIPNFSQVTLWRGTRGDYLLLAQSDTAPLNFNRLHKLWSEPGLQSDYSELGLLQPEGLLAYLELEDSSLRPLAAHASQNTDDLTRLEYRAPLAIYAADALQQNELMIAGKRSQTSPPLLHVCNPQQALLDAADSSFLMGDLPRAQNFLGALPSNFSPTAQSELLRGKLFLAANQLDPARTALENAARLDPSSSPTLLLLARVHFLQNDFPAAENFLRQVLARDPQSISALDAYADLEAARDNFPQAVDYQKHRIAADPQSPASAFDKLADFSLRSGDARSAESAFTSALALDPYDGTAHFILAHLYLKLHRPQEARKHLELAIRYFPAANSLQYLSLATIYLQLGQPRSANSVLAKGRRVFPADPSLDHLPAVNP